jgi:hypothetical protein
MTTLSEKAATALQAAFATKGKHKGMLLKRCPPSSTLAAAAWQGVMMAVNPYQVSIGACLFHTDEQRAVFNAVLAAIEALPRAEQIALQRDRATLERLGVW